MVWYLCCHSDRVAPLGGYEGRSCSSGSLRSAGHQQRRIIQSFATRTNLDLNDLNRVVAPSCGAFVLSVWRVYRCCVNSLHYSAIRSLATSGIDVLCGLLGQQERKSLVSFTTNTSGSFNVWQPKPFRDLSSRLTCRPRNGRCAGGDL